MSLLVGEKVGSAATPINPLDSIDPAPHTEEKKGQGKEEKIISNSDIRLKDLKQKTMKKQIAIPQVSKRLNVVPLVMSQSMAVSNQALKYLLIPNLEQ